MMRRGVLGSNFERASDGESLAMKPLMKNTLEQLTEKNLLVGLNVKLTRKINEVSTKVRTLVKCG